jgi:hypothetical protein
MEPEPSKLIPTNFLLLEICPTLLAEARRVLVQKAVISGNTWSKLRSTKVLVTRCWSDL